MSSSLGWFFGGGRNFQEGGNRTTNVPEGTSNSTSGVPSNDSAVATAAPVGNGNALRTVGLQQAEHDRTGRLNEHQSQGEKSLQQVDAPSQGQMPINVMPTAPNPSPADSTGIAGNSTGQKTPPGTYTTQVQGANTMAISSTNPQQEQQQVPTSLNGNAVSTDEVKMQMVRRILAQRRAHLMQAQQSTLASSQILQQMNQPLVQQQNAATSVHQNAAAVQQNAATSVPVQQNAAAVQYLQPPQAAQASTATTTAAAPTACYPAPYYGMMNTNHLLGGGTMPGNGIAVTNQMLARNTNNGQHHRPQLTTNVNQAQVVGRQEHVRPNLGVKHAVQRKAEPTTPDYVRHIRYSPIVPTPTWQFNTLGPIYRRLNRSDCTVLASTDLIILKRRTQQERYPNSFERKVAKQYISSKPARFRTELPILCCRACCSNHPRFYEVCNSFEELKCSFYRMKLHLLIDCPGTTPDMKQTFQEFKFHLSDTSIIDMYFSCLVHELRLFTVDPLVIEILSDDEDEMIEEAIPMSESEEICYENMDMVAEAMDTRSMGIEGVIGLDFWDLPIDAQRESTWALNVVENLSVVRIDPKARLAGYTELHEKHGGEFFVVCKCCRGRNPDGSMNPAAIVPVVESRSLAVKITTLLFKHMKECAKGRQLERLIDIGFDGQHRVKFGEFATSLHARCISLVNWIGQPKVQATLFDPKPDSEIWVPACTGDTLRRMLDTHGHIPCSNLTGPPKPAGAPGSKVLECWGFPRRGVLHGQIKPFSKQRVRKVSRFKLAKQIKQLPRPGSRVSDVDTLTNIDAANIVRKSKAKARRL